MVTQDRLFNHKPADATDPALRPRFATGTVDLRQLLSWRKGDERSPLRHSAIRRVKLEVLQRNAKILDVGNALNMENLTAQRLFESFMAFQKERERNVKVLQRKRDEMRAAAQTNIEALKEALGVREPVSR